MYRSTKHLGIIYKSYNLKFIELFQCQLSKQVQYQKSSTAAPSNILASPHTCTTLVHANLPQPIIYTKLNEIGFKTTMSPCSVSTTQYDKWTPRTPHTSMPVTNLLPLLQCTLLAAPFVGACYTY